MVQPPAPKASARFALPASSPFDAVMVTMRGRLLIDLGTYEARDGPASPERGYLRGARALTNSPHSRRPPRAHPALRPSGFRNNAWDWLRFFMPSQYGAGAFPINPEAGMLEAGTMAVGQANVSTS